MSLQPSPSLPLRDQIEGTVIGPEDPEYDLARTPVAGGFDRHPAAIFRVAGARDIARVVRYATETGSDLAVRSGGHSAAAHCVCDGLVIDLAPMKAMEIDRDARTIWAETGLTAGEIADALADSGLAVPFGDTASVGIGGITLGGGAGYLVRKYGLTIDSVLGAEIVTADGEIVRADAETHPDLFWAIRGGGGNFGVVTRFQYRLREVAGGYGGLLVLPATPAVLAGFIAAAQAAPEELSSIVNVMPAPPAPFIPEEHRGATIVMAQLFYAGDGEAAVRALAPFRALATPLADMIRPLAYRDILAREPAGEFRPIVVMETGFSDTVDETAATRIVESIGSSDAMMRVVQLRVLGGAVTRVPPQATAFAHRDAGVFVQVVSTTDGSADDRRRRIAWVRDLADALRDFGPAYVNALSDTSTERVRAAYGPAAWERLVEVKRRYDPGNLFHVNYNVPPEAD